MLKKSENLVEKSIERQLMISNAYGNFFNSCDLAQWDLIYAHFMELVRKLKFCYQVKRLKDIRKFKPYLTDDRIAFITSNVVKPRFIQFHSRPSVYEDIPIIGMNFPTKTRKKRLTK